MTRSQLIVVDSPRKNASVPGVFAAGDVSDTHYRKRLQQPDWVYGS
jgi:thioredoxin reductase